MNSKDYTKNWTDNAKFCGSISLFITVYTSIVLAKVQLVDLEQDTYLPFFT